MDACLWNLPFSETSNAPVDISCPSIMFVVKNIKIQAYICNKDKNSM